VNEQYKSLDNFDRVIGALAGLPDVAHTKPSTVVSATPLIGETQTFIVQTYRRREEGDTIFLQVIEAGRSLRLVIPAKAADAIARQREALTAQVRKKIGRESAAARAAKGIPPAFLTNPPKRKRAKKKAVVNG
jgi:hypothetical protein